MIAEEIRDTIATISDIDQFMYESPGVANIRLDRAQFPCALLYCINTTVIDTSLGYQREEAECNLFFLTKADSIDFDGWKNEAKIADMKALAMKFYTTLTSRGRVTVDGTRLQMQSVFDKGDVLTTGVSFQFRAVEKVGSCPNYTPQPLTLTIDADGEYDVKSYDKVIVNVGGGDE